MKIDTNLVKYFPVMVPPNLSAVLICEQGDGAKADEVVQKAREAGASNHMGGDEIFWTIFPSQSDRNRAWDCTERLLREELTRL